MSAAPRTTPGDRLLEVLKLKQAALRFLTEQNDRHLIEAQSFETDGNCVRQHESEFSELLQIICGRRYNHEIPEAIVMARTLQELAAEVETPSHLRRQAE